MTTPHRTLLQQALDALDRHADTEDWELKGALRKALAAPEPEPVAYLVEGWHDGKLIAHIPRLTLEDAKASAAVFSQHYTTTKLVPLYAAPLAAPADPWRAAALDRLAALYMDAPQDESPESILRRILEAEVAIALDPRVSDAAPPAAPAPHWRSHERPSM